MSNYARYAELLNVNCGNCSSACCREGMVIDLSSDEAQLLRDNGTTLIPYISGDRHNISVSPLLSVRSQYILGTDCAFIGETEDGQSICTIFGSENRPQICSDFPPSCNACIVRRERYGVNDQDTVRRFCDLEQSNY